MGPVIARRQFLLATGAVVLAGCSFGDDAPEAPAVSAPTDAGGSDPLIELRDALRTSADHRSARLAEAVESRDLDAIIGFVRQLQPLPVQPRGLADEVRFGPRAALRGGAGTPRDLAELALEAVLAAGFDAELGTLGSVGLADFARPRDHPAFDPRIADDLAALLGLDDGDDPAALDIDGARTAIESSWAEVLPEASADAGIDFGVVIDEYPDVATVVVDVDGEPRALDLYGDGASLVTPGRRDVGPARPGSLEVEVFGRRISDQEYLPLVAGTWQLPDVAGRRVRIGFVPPVDSLEEYLAVEPAAQTAFVPMLSVEGPELDDDARSELVVAGEAFSIGGVVLDDAAGTRASGDPADVTAVELAAVDARGFPQVVADLRVAGDGGPIDHLPAEALTVEDDGEVRAFTIERAESSPPAVLVVLDASESVDADYRGEGAVAFLRAVISGVRTSEPDASFGVQVLDGPGLPIGSTDQDLEELARGGASNGSDLWGALAEAGTTTADVVVMVTDAFSVDRSDTLVPTPPEADAVRIAAGPPAVVVLTAGTEPRPDIAAQLADRSGGAVIDGLDVATTVDQVVDTVNARRHNLRLRWTAPPIDGRHDVTVTIGDRSATSSYEADGTGLTDGFVGLYLRVRTPTAERVHTLAGAAFTPRFADASLAGPPEADDVRRALFGSFELVVEAGAPTTGTIVAEYVDAVIAVRDGLAGDDADRRAAFAAVGAPRVDVAALQRRLDHPDAVAATVRMDVSPTLVARRVIATDDADRDAAVTLLDVTAWGEIVHLSTDEEARRQAVWTASAALGAAESLLGEHSTAARLGDSRLVALARSTDAGDRVDDYRRLVGVDDRSPVLVAADGPIDAGWRVDTATGSVLGLLGAAAGGAAEVEEINATFNRVKALLDLTEAVPGGAGVWATFENAKLEQLRRSTISIATLRDPGGSGEPAPDASELLTGPLCNKLNDRANGALDRAAGSLVGGGLFGRGRAAINRAVKLLNLLEGDRREGLGLKVC